MASRIEDYALIGDLHTAALVSRDGSIDWLCLPRFDSGSIFTALLGDESHGHWSISPKGGAKSVRRHYRQDTLVLETEFETDGGAVRIVDFMPPRDEAPTVIRRVEGIRGEVRMEMNLILRFDYGSVVPWVRNLDGRLLAIGGPDSVWLTSDVPVAGKNLTSVADFTVSEGETCSFTMVWAPSHLTDPPAAVDPASAAEDTTRWWREWVAQCPYEGHWRDEVVRSLITLKALTYQPTGGILAAATTSLPEKIGGVRNWDYRFCWVRDATFSLYSLIDAGFHSEAIAWRDWLLRAVSGQPEQLQIMYGPAGERRLAEFELDWLPGFEDSSPVRIGNGAVNQFQLDVFGELMDSMYQARHHGIDPEPAAWELQKALMDTLESKWTQPDDGIWEIRGPQRHFTHSKVMAWVAADRAAKAVESFDLEGPVDRWRELRKTIHDEVVEKGYDADMETFTQYYGSSTLDASLLMIPLVGFLPPSDPRVVGTTKAVRDRLGQDGLVLRYLQDDEDVDGLPGGEGFFLPCSFWLADNLWLMGRHSEANQLFERLNGFSNDVGLFSEEYDTSANRMLGNFPQAFTHVSMINTAFNISGEPGPGHRRSRS